MVQRVQQDPTTCHNIVVPGLLKCCRSNVPLKVKSPSLNYLYLDD